MVFYKAATRRKKTLNRNKEGRLLCSLELLVLLVNVCGVAFHWTVPFKAPEPSSSSVDRIFLIMAGASLQAEMKQAVEALRELEIGTYDHSRAFPG